MIVFWETKPSFQLFCVQGHGGGLGEGHGGGHAGGDQEEDEQQEVNDQFNQIDRFNVASVQKLIRENGCTKSLGQRLKFNMGGTWHLINHSQFPLDTDT